MVTFEQLQQANETINTVNIKGKEYAEVNQRIKAFRMVYPDGFIRTELLSNENGVCIFRASVGYIGSGNEIFMTDYKGCEKYGDCKGVHVLGVGHAYEKEDSTFINKTSYIENCETSAVGRALGMAGFGIDTSVASAEELENAIANQDDGKLITKAKAKTLEDMILSYNLDIKTICEYYKHESLSEFTEKEFASALRKLNATKNKMKGESKNE